MNLIPLMSSLPNISACGDLLMVIGLGLDFSYNGTEYRFNTGSIYEKQDTILPNGKEALFGLYRKDSNPKAKKKYILLEEFADMEDALNSTCIEGIAFRIIIMDDNTEILGQD